MAPRHVVVVLNPNAPGAASVLDALHQIANDDPSRYTLLLLTSPDISELVAAALDRHGKGGCCFVAGGGDGTLAAVASILEENYESGAAAVPVAPLPLGKWYTIC
jgi:diacylglycerol kinase family enzyme